jgi:zinc D-Ala-D-Ala dipeptidase
MSRLFHTTLFGRSGTEQDADASPYNAPTLVGRTLRNGIHVLARLAHTPEGELFRAQYPRGPEVAILLLNPVATSPTALDALQQRLRRAMQIQHPNVAAIHDIDETHDGLSYAVVESLNGELLSEMLARRGTLPLSVALDVFLQAADGLEAAHAARCTHGSLSPRSILLTPTSQGPQVKLIRFAHGSLPPEYLDPRDEVDGSADYASPERLAGGRTDERSDVYSLGALLHHLLTGAPPGRASEGGQLPDFARPVLDRALAPSPAERYQTVAELVAAITPRQAPVDGPPPAPTGRARRALAAVGVVGLGLAVGCAALWLLTGVPRLPLPSLVRPRPPESGAVTQAEPEARSARSSASLHGSAPDSQLVDVRTLDSTIQVDLRYATENNFTGAPLPGYEAPRALLRPEAAAALARVQARLRSGRLGLRVFDAYRPIRASRAMVDWAERTGHKDLLESGYIAERSRHNLGSAVDLALVNLETGAEVPMGTTFDSFASGDTDQANVTGEALQHRRILRQAMESEGFSPYGQAWWHFNYPPKGAVPLDQVIR